jgi:CubicO group peptidase (beta-lactamase class C family)
MKRLGLAAAAAVLVACGAAWAATPPRDAPPPGLRPLLENALAHASNAKGLTVIVMRGGRRLYRMDIGDIAPDQQFPIASASKWLTGALVMSVVDEGKLSLDAPISTVLPEFNGEAARITLRELLSQTAGMGSLKAGFDIRQPATITLAQSAAQIAARPLEDPPGRIFNYGGPHFQVAGAMVEAVTGKRWADLFNERIAGPLGMTHTSWLHLPRQTETPAQTLNPLLQGGVVTTAEDYMRFLTMLAGEGEYQGRRVLSRQAVDAMETNQTLGVTMGYVPPGATVRAAQYALANWCDAWDKTKRCTRVSSPGAFGTTPWIDRDSGLYGIFFIMTRNPDVAEPFAKAEAMIIEANR